MKKVFVFEHALYNGALEKKFYHFCLLRQISLVKYLFVYFWFSILYFFRIISKEKYFEKRWSFLCDVKGIEDRISSFWKSHKKGILKIAADGENIWLSEYPEVLLTELSQQYGVQLAANTYDITAKTFSNFNDNCGLYEKSAHGEKPRIYDEYSSKLKKVNDADFNIVYNRKTFSTPKKYWIYRILCTAYTGLALLVLGIGLGIASLYFAASNYHMAMFRSYFKIDHLALLNIFPVVFCIFLLYFIFNRVWFSFFLTTALTMTFTWINYYKLLFRNDPLMAVDLTLFSESKDMAGKYNVHLTWQIIVVIAACVISIVASMFIVRGRILKIRYRLIGIVLLAFLGVYCFNNIYMSSKLYNSIENYGLANRWSSTDVYISRGFIYPFIYSIKSCFEKPPAGYNEKEAKAKLFSYNYSDIPGNKKVNVVSVMMEAYNDFSKFHQVKFNIDIYGYLHQLEAESYSGELVTNIFAGGTVQTERAFLTGYTVLPNFRSDINTYARYFGEQGYTVEGSHPCYDWFYNRRNVNEYLGFENYYFFENKYSKLANGQIARDEILFPEILNLYEANKKTGKPYFSFNVTYQNHGPYSTEKRTDVQYVKNQGYSEKEYNIMNNYFAGVYSTTQQLKTLIDHFRNEKEPVVVILFGDHNPWMGDGNSVYKMLGIDFNLGTEKGFYNYYDTPYIIWANDSAKKTLGNDFKGKGPRIGPYFLMNEFFKLAGYEGNEFMKASNELEKTVDVVHVNNRYKGSGILTPSLSADDQQKLDDFLKIQYYWKKNFRSSVQK